MTWTLTIHHEHPWDVTPAEARDIQTQLATQVETVNRLGEVRHVAGLDVAFARDGKTTCAAVVLLALPELVVLEHHIVCRATTFPYVPGLLSFREVPALLDALRQLETAPDLLLCDGQGYAHPRRCGIASHLGVLTDTPSVGVGKSGLLGEHTEPGPRRGDWSPLMDSGECVGAVLRTRERTKSLYVSIGHRVDLQTAIALTLACLTRYRLPEPTRLADQWVGLAARRVDREIGC